MKNKQLSEELQQSLISLCTATASLNTLSSLAQKIETRLKELEEKEGELQKLEERIDGKTRDLEEREKKLKESEEKSKATIKESEEKIQAAIKESEEKRRVWEETEKQMEINSQKVKNLVKVNVGMPSHLCLILFQIIFNLFYSGGKHFTASKESLMKYKGSYFESMISSNYCQFDDSGRYYTSSFVCSYSLAFNRYYIDRDSKNFRMILAFLRDGKLNEVMTKEQHDEMQQEFFFYKIPFVSLSLLS